MTSEQLIPYIEHRRLQLVAFKENTPKNLPSSVGSAFILDYKGESFILTADHVVNTHDNGTRVLDKSIYVQTNRVRKEANGLFSCELLSMGGVTFFSQFSVNPSTGDINVSPLFDAAFVRMNDLQKSIGAVTIESDFNGVHINAGESIVHYQETDIALPSKTDRYFIFGQIKPRYIACGQQMCLIMPLTFKQELEFIGEDTNYYILKTNDITIYDDWGGLSGSAVVNQDGKIIGIACFIVNGGHWLFVKKIQSVTPLMEADILTNKLP